MPDGSQVYIQQSEGQNRFSIIKQASKYLSGLKYMLSDNEMQLKRMKFIKYRQSKCTRKTWLIPWKQR